MFYSKIKLWLKQFFWYIPLSAFLLLGALAAYSWYLGYVDFGIGFQSTFPLFPYYSPHKYNIIIYSIFFALVFTPRFKNWAFPYFIMAYFIQESIDNIFVTIPQLLTDTKDQLGFISTPPFNGGILWVSILIFLVIGFGLFFYLRPTIKLDTYWKILLLGIWLWIDRSYLGNLVIAYDPVFQNSFGNIVEILRNTSYMVLVTFTVYKKQ